MAPFALLDADYITAAEHRARRFSGAYTGTSGTLAADVMRLLDERKTLMTTLESANAALRDAVRERLDSTPADDPKLRGYSPMAASLAGCKPAQEAAARCFNTTTEPKPTDIDDSDTPAIPVDWILQGQQEFDGQRLRGDGVLNAASETYAEWKPAFQAKTAAHETLDNAIAAVLDRHQKYGPPTEHFARTAGMVNAAFGTSFTAADWALVMVLDKVARQRGPAATDDAAIDIAGYAACHQECRQAAP